MTETHPKQDYEIFIRTTPEKLWQALTESASTKKYFFSTAIESKFDAGDPFAMMMPDGRKAVEGQVLECEPGHKLVLSWRFLYDPELAAEQSRVTWLIEQRGDVCKLRLIHDLDGAPKSARHVAIDGWSMILSGLKTLLETGKTLA